MLKTSGRVELKIMCLSESALATLRGFPGYSGPVTSEKEQKLNILNTRFLSERFLYLSIYLDKLCNRDTLSQAIL